MRTSKRTDIRGVGGGADEPVYGLRGVTREFGGGGVAVRAIDAIDLEIGAGEFCVVAGPSGSGKSTLLQLLGALDRPTGGEVMFEGRNLAGMGETELAGLRLRTIGFIFQQFNLIPTLSASENVEAALAPTGIRSDERRARATELLERVGLQGRISHLPSQLSGGEQQRVAIARALANRPDVVLADEPTGNLDSATGETILSLLRSLWEEEGLTLILITHDLEIARTAPRVLRLLDGRVTEEGGGDAAESRAAIGEARP
jgi:putative ABC transport system ATP-binding protein